MCLVILGKLEQQAMKFKPKLDKMQEKVVAQKLEQQELKRKQQEQASQQYMENVYNTLKEGTINDIKMDRKVQAMLYNGLVQPNYPSVSGKNTNLLGHLLEKYQFVEPNHELIAEALWLLADPDGYKGKIMEKGSQIAPSLSLCSTPKELPPLLLCSVLSFLTVFSTAI